MNMLGCRLELAELDALARAGIRQSGSRPTMKTPTPAPMQRSRARRPLRLKRPAPRPRSALRPLPQRCHRPTSISGDAAEELQHWIGRFEALASAVAAARTDFGISVLDGVAGVIGVLSDLVTIDDGWEAAAEAAADGALSAVVVRDDGAAAAALAAFADGEASGSVISLDQLPAAREPKHAGRRRRPSPASSFETAHTGGPRYPGLVPQPDRNVAGRNRRRCDLCSRRLVQRL